jgi:hypothetical protein
VGIVAGIAEEEAEMYGKEFSSKLSDEILKLALQHPYHDLHGRSGVE